jgi:hypothetical protein
MKSQFLYILFKFIPKGLWKIIGESSMLRVFRNALIRDQKGFSIVLKKKIMYAVSWYKNIEFIFIAPPKE